MGVRLGEWLQHALVLSVDTPKMRLKKLNDMLTGVLFLAMYAEQELASERFFSELAPLTVYCMEKEENTGQENYENELAKAMDFAWEDFCQMMEQLFLTDEVLGTAGNTLEEILRELDVYEIPEFILEHRRFFLEHLSIYIKETNEIYYVKAGYGSFPNWTVLAVIDLKKVGEATWNPDADVELYENQEGFLSELFYQKEFHKVGATLAYEFQNVLCDVFTKEIVLREDEFLSGDAEDAEPDRITTIRPRFYVMEKSGKSVPVSDTLWNRYFGGWDYSYFDNRSLYPYLKPADCPAEAINERYVKQMVWCFLLGIDRISGMEKWDDTGKNPISKMLLTAKYAVYPESFSVVSVLQGILDIRQLISDAAMERVRECVALFQDGGINMLEDLYRFFLECTTCFCEQHTEGVLFCGDAFRTLLMKKEKEYGDDFAAMIRIHPEMFFEKVWWEKFESKLSWHS